MHCTANVLYAALQQPQHHSSQQLPQGSCMYVRTAVPLPHLRQIFNPLKGCIKSMQKKLSLKKAWKNGVLTLIYVCKFFRPLIFLGELFAFLSTVPKPASNFVFYGTHLTLWPKTFSWLILAHLTNLEAKRGRNSSKN